MQAHLIAGFHGYESTPRHGIHGRIHFLEMGALCQRQESLKKLFPVSLNSQQLSAQNKTCAKVPCLQVA